MEDPGDDGDTLGACIYNSRQVFRLDSSNTEDTT